MKLDLEITKAPSLRDSENQSHVFPHAEARGYHPLRLRRNGRRLSTYFAWAGAA